MATDLTVILRDVPGTLADLGEATGKAGVNIEGIGGFECGGEGVLHVLVEDADTARQAIEAAGMEVRDQRDVLVIDMTDTPGEMGRVMRRIADAGVNVNLLYLATNTRAVIGAEDIERARAAASAG